MVAMPGRLVLIIFVMAGASLPGCYTRQTGFDAPDPNARLDAIVQATELSDRSKLANLIDQLDSDDPAARMLAIRGLEDMTGERLGYDPAAPEWQRDESIQRWRAWYAELDGADVEQVDAYEFHSDPIPLSSIMELVNGPKGTGEPARGTAELNEIVEVTRTDDRSRTGALIGLLASEDPVARLLAIRGLERMTGQTLGYEYDAPEPERNDAISRWEQWYAGSGTDPRGEGGPTGQVSAMR